MDLEGIRLLELEPEKKSIISIVALLMLLFAGSSIALAQETQHSCYIISSTTARFQRLDNTTVPPPDSPDLTDIGKIDNGKPENIAYDTQNEVVYTVLDEDEFGCLDQSTGDFNLIAKISGGGNASGELGGLELDDNINSMSYDVSNNLLWAVNTEQDGMNLLFRIDVSGVTSAAGTCPPTSTSSTFGEFEADAFGAGVDYVVITDTTGTINNVKLVVHDIAVHPTTGVMYASVSDDSGTYWLVIIDSTNGDITTVVGDFGVEGMEGLGFALDGTLYCVTRNGVPADDSNKLWIIDYQGNSGPAGTAYEVIDIEEQPDGVSGYRAITCLLDITVTQVFLSSFRAYYGSGGTVVEWETAAEIGTVGFNLFREGAGGEWGRVNSELLPGLLHHQTGGTYSFFDGGAAPGEIYRYMLEEVESSGKINSYGPFEVMVERGAAGENKTRAFYQSGGFTKSPRELSEFAYKRLAQMEKELFKKGFNIDVGAISSRASNNGNNLGKVYITEKGIYYLSAAEIGSILGAAENRVKRWIRRGRIRIRNRGEQVSYRPAPGSGGIYFYAEGIESVFTNKNVYWLSTAKGKVMEVVEGDADSGGEGTFKWTEHFEENQWGPLHLATDREDDFWMWEFVMISPSVNVNTSKEFKTYGVAETGGEATLVVTLRGDTATTHHVIIRVNGEEFESTWEGPVEHIVTAQFSQSALVNGVEGENVIEVEGALDEGVSFSLFYLDSFDVIYEKLYDAWSERLFFNDGGNSVITITGFTNAEEVQVYEITEPKKPRIMAVNTEMGVVSFEAEPGSEYVAVSNGGLSEPYMVKADVPSSLKSGRNAGEYLIVTTGELMGAAGELAAHRRGQGLSAFVADVENIYDEFNYGIEHPDAIKTFIRRAWSWWEVRPEYVVIAGDGTYDFRGHRAEGTNLIPPYMVQTPYGWFSADHGYVDVRGNDGVPEIAFGRIPVLTAAGLGAYVQKVIEYESNGTAEWARNVLMGADKGVAFTNTSEKMASFIGSEYVVNRVNLDDLSMDDARAELFGSLNNGVLLFNYIGHAGHPIIGFDPATNSSLLTTGDLGLINNGDRLWLVTALTCVIGRTELPEFATTLGEELVLKAGGGAVAVWSPTGLSQHSEAVKIGEIFFRKVFQNGERNLGMAVLDALNEYAETRADPWMVEIFTLIGDPAVILKSPIVPELPPGDDGAS